MEVDLCSHLKFNGETFYWDSTITDLKVFVSCDLKLTGRWLSPGGEVKTFTSDTLVLKWHGKTNKWITLSGSSTEVSELSQTLQSLCKKAEENQAAIVEIHQTLPTNNGKEKPSVHLAAPTENQTEYSVRSNNDDKSYEDNFASIENQLKTLESKFLDKTLSIANDLNNLKKYCLNNEVEGMNILRQENASLKVENEALKDSLYTAKFALSDLNTKVKDLEHEKASLTTTLKILYMDFHQAHEAHFKQQDPPIVVNNNNHANDKSPSSIAERDVGNCLSHTADETIPIPDDQPDTDNKVCPTAQKRPKSGKVKAKPKSQKDNEINQVEQQSSKQNSNAQHSDKSQSPKKKSLPYSGTRLLKIFKAGDFQMTIITL
ncbi:Hypothetical predicted protein [Paramuricea clavata]|uniref:Uncharacterized protein n=1 Tax=Paramuricea clavata TaxID=317549 RepID=A0A6S7JXB8_PARCT|nr:Hypothetical predicted protein [Paramuricea clavata]